MTHRDSVPELSAESDTKAAEQLNRILASKAFRQADRLKRFLTFIVDETIAGRGERLKEFVVGVEVFGKDNSFDPRNDPIVRVQARRLRSQLARYYQEEGQGDEVVIDLPKGGYAPVFRSIRAAPAKRAIVPALISRNTVLVQAFEDDSPGGDLEYFCNGLSTETIQALSALEEVRLVAAASLSAAAERPNAALVIGGSVRKNGSRLRIAMNLIDTATGCYVWSSTIDRTEDDPFAVQEEVARLIASQLKAELSGSPTKSDHGHTGNLAAYNLFVQGRYHLNQRTEEGLRKAVEFFERAIVEDAQSALAYSGLADAHSLLGHYGVLTPAEVWTKAASNAAWAVLQDENSAEAHTSLAHVKSTQDWDWLGAQQEFRRAIELNPRYPTAHHWYAVSCLAPIGKLDEARDEMLIAEALDPISSIIARDLARVHYYRQDYEAALEQCDHAIELNPHFSPAYWILGLVQEQRGDLDESAAAFQRAIQLSPQSPILQAGLGRTLALSGKRGEALKILEELHARAAKRYVSPLELAALHFALGQDQQGFQWLTKAFQDRCFELIGIHIDPRFRQLKTSPQFLSLFEQLGLP